MANTQLPLNAGEKMSIESITLKFYKGCIFHNGRKTYGRFRTKDHESWEDLCEECYTKMSQSSEFLKEHDLETVR